MRISRLSFIFVSVGVILFVASLSSFAQLETPPAPTYEGKPIGFWLSHLEFVGVNQDGMNIERGTTEIYRTVEEAERHQKSVKEIRAKVPAALRHIGEAALPYIYRMLIYNGDPAEKFEFLPKPEDDIRSDTSARAKRGQAIVALQVLKDHRNVIEPQLKVLLSQKNKDPDVKGAILAAMKSIEKKP